jgi:signal transduction histidine kinase
VSGLRTAVFGEGLRALNVKPTPKYRFRIVSRAQLPFLVLTNLILLLIAAAGVDPEWATLLVVGWVGLDVLTLLSLVVPWERDVQVGGFLIPTIDLLLIAVISGAIAPEYPMISALMLVPVLVLSFAFGPAGVASSILGGVLITALPFVIRGDRPGSLAETVELLIVPLSVSLLAAGGAFASAIVQRIQRKLEETTHASEVAAAASENERAVIITVLETMDVGTAFVSEDGTTAFTNAAFRALVERSAVDPETRAGTKVFDTDRVTPVPPEHQMLSQAARGHYFESRLYWIGEGADQRGILVTARPVIGRDGTKIGSAFVSKDVTDLTDAIKLREDFLAGVSHELRTPLTSIIGYLEVIEDSIDLDTMNIGAELAIVQRNANQLMMRIGDLLNVTDESVSLHLRLVEVAAILKQAVDAIRFRADNAGVSVDVELSAPFTANVDPGRLAQVLDNLLTNAVKYTPGGGAVTATITPSATDFTVAIADTGTGIGTADLRHIFDRFYRSASVRGGGISGAGLGLAIVKNIVTAHGGSIDVDSELGVGTTVSVRIPRRL